MLSKGKGRRRVERTTSGGRIGRALERRKPRPRISVVPKEEKIECVLCWEDVPKSQMVRCKCSNIICMDCITKLIESNRSPVCNECRDEFDEAYLHRVLPKGWMEKTYKPLIKERYHIEVTSDPEARIEEVHRYDRGIELMAKLKEAKGRLKEHNSTKRNAENAVEWDNRRSVLRTEVNDIRSDINNLGNTGSSQASSSQTSTYSCSCPYDNCGGLVDAQTRKCVICERRVCIRCHEKNPKDVKPKHECDPNTVETIKLLKADTKRCPKCKVSIHRHSGCPQMFCTECKTYFNWNTLKIDSTGTYVNPEANDLARRLGVTTDTFRNPNAAQPDSSQGAEVCREGINSIPEMTGTLEQRSKVHLIYLRISEIPGTIIQWYNYDMETTGIKSRVLYTKGEMSKAAFCDRYYRFDRERKRRQNITDNLLMFYQVASDNFNHFRSVVQKAPDSDEGVQAFIEHMDVIRSEFCKVINEDVGYLGGTVSPYILKDWSRWVKINRHDLEEDSELYDYKKVLVTELRSMAMKYKVLEKIPKTGKSGRVKADFVKYFSENYPKGPPTKLNELDAIRAYAPRAASSSEGISHVNDSFGDSWSSSEDSWSDEGEIPDESNNIGGYAFTWGPGNAMTAEDDALQQALAASMFSNR